MPQALDNYKENRRVSRNRSFFLIDFVFVVRMCNEIVLQANLCIRTNRNSHPHVDGETYLSMRIRARAIKPNK